MVDTAVTEAPTELRPDGAGEVTGLAEVTGPFAGGRPVSPAAHLAEQFAAAEVGGARAVRIREVPFLTMVGLRAVPGSVAAERIASLLGVALPAAVGLVSAGHGVSVLWLSPDEFLAVFDDQTAGAETVDDLRQVQGTAGSGSVVDLSANRTTLELAGPSARAVLEKGCPLDLHPRTFELGSAYVTLIGSVSVLLWKVADETYRIMPRSSYADFLGRWLLDAMGEFRTAEPV